MTWGSTGSKMMGSMKTGGGGALPRACARLSSLLLSSLLLEISDAALDMGGLFSIGEGTAWTKAVGVSAFAAQLLEKPEPHSKLPAIEVGEVERGISQGVCRDQDVKGYCQDPASQHIFSGVTQFWRPHWPRFLSHRHEGQVIQACFLGYRSRRSWRGAAWMPFGCSGICAGDCLHRREDIVVQLCTLSEVQRGCRMGLARCTCLGGKEPTGAPGAWVEGKEAKQSPEGSMGLAPALVSVKGTCYVMSD
ncbi:hypothetical protein FB451DRAFT_1167165 [Mycena latifolia]|nr:hypothetical protein FB451DRAFT_1167165 [Mycena latifolia]